MPRTESKAQTNASRLLKITCRNSALRRNAASPARASRTLSGAFSEFMRKLRASLPADNLRLRQIPTRLRGSFAEGTGRGHGVRLFHPQRQSLRQQYTYREPVCDGDLQSGAARRGARHALRLDWRAPFQLARRLVLPGPRARPYRSRPQA